MWEQILIALALLLIIEGIMPFINPNGWKNLLRAILDMDNAALRTGGFISMMIGLVLLYTVN